MEVVKFLVELGGKELVMLVTRHHRESCLHRAVKRGHADIAQALVEAGGKELLMLVTSDQKSCLHIAAERDNLEVVKVLVEAGGKELLMLSPEEPAPPCIARAVEWCDAKLLAFAMGTQTRLGAESAVRVLDAPELLAMVRDAYWSV